MDLVMSYVLAHGRVARATWFYRLIGLILVCTAFGMLGKYVAGETGATLFAALFVWCSCAISTQRLHDIGKSGWSLLFFLIPVFGPIWLFVQLTSKGAEGSNRYGKDPLSRQGYLTVNIAH
ncbi:Uncharacterized membrane protein YhaH, DUF805 family [Collimonas sp. OK607]|nr:Uncharacterized membrane protein YhaH, DUF805 family [Collimonas sp. OK607]